jgi:hypothetical protein
MVRMPAWFCALLHLTLSVCGASGATVQPVFTNDTAANNLSFNDTFGHTVVLGTYNSSTGVWTASISAGVTLNANAIVLGGGAGIAPSTPVGLGTTTQVLHGNAAGAPSWTGITNADMATVFASPPALGSTAPAALFGSALEIGIPGGSTLDGGGSVDNAAVLQAALTAAASGGFIQLPCGKFKVSSANLTVTVASGKTLIFQGSGHECTKIFFSGASSGQGLAFTEADLSASAIVRGMSFTTDQTSGTNLALQIINTGTNANPAGSMNNIIDDVIIRGDDWSNGGNADYFSTGIYINNTNTVSFNNVSIWGVAAFNLGTGVLLTGKPGATSYAVVANFGNFIADDLNVGIDYTSYFQGVTVTNSNFTGDQYGIFVPVGALGTIDQLSVSNTQFADFKSGIQENTTLGDTSVSNSFFNIPPGTGSHGIDLLSTRATIAGNSFYGAAQATSVGINVAATCVACVITGNSIRSFVTGISAASGATGLVTGNMFDANTNAFGGTFTSAFQVYNNSGDATFVNTSPNGVTNGIAAAAGHIGEVIDSTIPLGSAVAMSNGVARNITSIALTAGDWDCRGGVGFSANAGTTFTQAAGSISSTTGTLTGNPFTEFFIAATLTTASFYFGTIPSFQVNISAPQTEYLVGSANFGVSTMLGYGEIQCRRMR